MAVRSERVTVTTTPTRLSADGTDNIAGTSVLVRCPDADLYLGGPDVTTGDGYLLPAGDPYAFDTVSGRDDLWGVVATGTATVHVLRGGV